MINKFDTIFIFLRINTLENDLLNKIDKIITLYQSLNIKDI